ncbi:MAG: hypothetical protein ACTSQA_00325 [Candidatus Heimdallarchaeaceae archaeon]
MKTIINVNHNAKLWDKYGVTCSKERNPIESRYTPKVSLNNFPVINRSNLEIVRDNQFNNLHENKKLKLMNELSKRLLNG